MPPKHVAIVTCSTRIPRLNPTITQYIHDVLASDPTIPTRKATSPSSDASPDTDPRHITLTILDLAAQSLPLYDEYVIPASLPPTDPTPHYSKEHTRAWSKVVRQYDAFIFVTPQYNWSIPASLKNALDYLFFEWKEVEERVEIDERDLEGWKEAGVEGMMRNLGMELVCELDKIPGHE
ncbi:uncharacterized protein N7484_004576 [Penicillium longicatenatum]|uniref:uncharacterized protein n=1 Tax=Penicillium longicatenatum TaxID=1561947 RepID=UPI0025479835|nr:uncharacterized protein N7484_004576 [Penicillium longicatenatum]KAJ5650853.1 hypothetical protein N7484_004576 [Penicillium longicatenatum]